MADKWLELPAPLNRIIDLDKAREVKFEIKFGDPQINIYWSKGDYLKITGPLAVDTWEQILRMVTPSNVPRVNTKATVLKKYGETWEEDMEDLDDADDDD